MEINKYKKRYLERNPPAAKTPKKIKSNTFGSILSNIFQVK